MGNKEIYIRNFREQNFYDQRIAFETGRYKVRKKLFKEGDAFNLEEEFCNRYFE